jgi:hypothetical protein
MNETKQRKIIQIAALPAPSDEASDGVMALTDDGRIYVLYEEFSKDDFNRHHRDWNHGKWRRLPDIP